MLLIIGLLISAILTGNDLIKISTFNSQISEWKQVAASYNTYFLKYNKIAGDDDDATSKFSGVTVSDEQCALSIKMGF